MKRLIKILLRIILVPLTIYVFVFYKPGTTLSALVAGTIGLVFFVIFILKRNIYWWTIPMDIISILIILFSFWKFNKPGYYELHVGILFSTFLLYCIINFVLSFYNYPWIKISSSREHDENEQ
ncbi:MAG: hypothetical protein JXR88_04150 [Clostridia bacterium]|nr:hypothetical protein [Clostridia bacterium]